ncbi:MAG: NAD-binding protein [Acidimicrobiales bacterium]
MLETFSSRVDRVGDNGAGLELKLVTNRLLTTHLAAIAEAVVTLEHTELSVDQAIELLRSGAVPKLLDYKSAALVERDYTPLFTVDLMAKDLRLAREGLAETPLAAAAHEIVEAATEAGFGHDDLAAIIEIIADRFPANLDKTD